MNQRLVSYILISIFLYTTQNWVAASVPRFNLLIISSWLILMLLSLPGIWTLPIFEGFLASLHFVILSCIQRWDKITHPTFSAVTSRPTASSEFLYLALRYSPPPPPNSRHWHKPEADVSHSIPLHSFLIFLNLPQAKLMPDLHRLV
jgi:hypothetical protein